MPEERKVDDSSSVEAMAVRVVHGGTRFTEPIVIDDGVLQEIVRLADLAPLHNPRAVEVIKETQREHPAVPIVAGFDTAFHQTMPELAWRYALPASVDVRRYGFHGISYSYIATRVTAARHIVCHLGNGASVCAMRDGKSADTSMGLTPLEGLVMGTRGGDLDPGLILYLLRKGESEESLDELLNKRSGLLGVSGSSSDMREVEKAAASGDARAELALELFAYRVAKYIGAYAAALEGIDALTFTAGIGEHSSSMRARICSRLGFLGITLDETLNNASRSDDRTISRGRVDVYVIPTNEELQLARMAHAVLMSQ
jgi:acetate kinase